MTRTCAVCTKDFQTTHRDRVTCSRTCSGLRRRRRLTLTCERPGCGKQFEIQASHQHQHGRTRRFCSRRCGAIVTRNCVSAKCSIGGINGAKVRFAAWWDRAMVGVRSMSQPEAFKAGYVLGYRRALRRQARERKEVAA